MAILTPRKAGEYLGISKRRVNKMVAQGIIPAYRVGNRWRIKEEDLHLAEEWRRKHGRRTARGDTPEFEISPPPPFSSAPLGLKIF